ncbi:hypothetical protein ACFE04_017390 [Oxalis oulophora]
MFFEIRKQKYLEELDKVNSSTRKAVDILVKELKCFQTTNENEFHQLVMLLPLGNSKYASSILRNLGKDAIGKIVEVHEPSDDTWHRGVVTDAVGGASTFSIRLHDGRLTRLTIGKQGVRFVPQKQKRTKRI